MYRENSKEVYKIRTVFIFEMKTTIFYAVTFLAFLLTNSSVAVSKFNSVCQLLLYRQCGKISQLQGAHTRS